MRPSSGRVASTRRSTSCSSAARSPRGLCRADVPVAIGFDAAVHALVRRVPSGRVVTYGQVAALVGVPRGARAVGGAMRRCPPGVPWHRVVNGRGAISRRGSASGMLTQRLLLAREGIRFARGRVDLGRHRWTAGRAGRGATPRVDIAALEVR